MTRMVHAVQRTASKARNTPNSKTRQAVLRYSALCVSNSPLCIRELTHFPVCRYLYISPIHHASLHNWQFELVSACPWTGQYLWCSPNRDACSLNVSDHSYGYARTHQTVHHRLYGVTLHQIYRYFRTYSRDPTVLKAMVRKCVICLFPTLNVYLKVISTL